MQSLKKDTDNDNLDYSFLFIKLDQMSRENLLYKKAFKQIEDVANKISGGNFSARINHLDKFDKHIVTLSAINKAYDFIDSFVRQSKASQLVALQKQDEFRKEQLRELRSYFEKEIVSVLP